MNPVSPKLKGPPTMIQALRGPVMMITIGVLFLLNMFTPFAFDRTWPLILIVLGVMALAETRTRQARLGTSMDPSVAPPPAYPPGAYPPRDNENSIRVTKYKLQFMLESAAVSTTKLMACAAAGTPRRWNTITKGLAVIAAPG